MDGSGIRQYNPWWDDPDSIDADPHLLRLDGSGIAYSPAPVPALACPEDPAIRLVHGPVQSGKTTLVKSEIRRLLKCVDPEMILYCPSAGTGGTLERYLEETKGCGHRYIFLDGAESWVWRAARRTALLAEKGISKRGI